MKVFVTALLAALLFCNGDATHRLVEVYAVEFNAVTLVNGRPSNIRTGFGELVYHLRNDTVFVTDVMSNQVIRFRSVSASLNDTLSLLPPQLTYEVYAGTGLATVVSMQAKVPRLAGS